MSYPTLLQLNKFEYISSLRLIEKSTSSKSISTIFYSFLFIPKFTCQHILLFVLIRILICSKF